MTCAALAETLARVADAAAGTAHDWWIIGSAAVALHGGTVADIRDVDVLMSPADAESFLKRVGAAPRRGEPDARFRSSVFGTWRHPSLPVEVMGGLQLATANGWRDVTLSTRQAVTVRDRVLFVPSADELVRLLHSFGRGKDLERARLLKR